MTDTQLVFIGGIIGAIITAVSQYLIARLSVRSKEDKTAELMQTYLKISEMTGDQLEESINQVWKLTTENISMRRELSELQEKRKDRDEQIEALQSQAAALQAQVNKDAAERGELSKKLSDFEIKYRAMWQYLLALLEQAKRHKLTPIDPPKELESDPHIMKIVQEIRGGK